MSNLAPTMLQAGAFHLVSGQEVPAAAVPLIAECPRDLRLVVAHLFPIAPGNFPAPLRDASLPVFLLWPFGL